MKFLQIIKSGIFVKREDFTVAHKICQENLSGDEDQRINPDLFTGCVSGACSPTQASTHQPRRVD